MATNIELREQQAIQALEQMVTRDLLSGNEPAAVTRKLEEMGWETEAAAELVGEIHGRIIAAQDREKFSPASLVPAVIGGATAALIGGGIWAPSRLRRTSRSATSPGASGPWPARAWSWAPVASAGFPCSSSPWPRASWAFSSASTCSSVISSLQRCRRKRTSPCPTTPSIWWGASLRRLPEMLTPHDILWVVLALGTAAKITKASRTQVSPVPASVPVTPQPEAIA